MTVRSSVEWQAVIENSFERKMLMPVLLMFVSRSLQVHIRRRLLLLLKILLLRMLMVSCNSCCRCNGALYSLVFVNTTWSIESLLMLKELFVNGYMHIPYTLQALPTKCLIINTPQKTMAIIVVIC